jgi:hypothetical protein
MIGATASHWASLYCNTVYTRNAPSACCRGLTNQPCIALSIVVNQALPHLLVHVRAEVVSPDLWAAAHVQHGIMDFEGFSSKLCI